jgi:hypothetical protein
MIEGFDLFSFTVNDVGIDVIDRTNRFTNESCEVSVHFHKVYYSDSHILSNAVYFNFDIRNLA